RSFRTSWKPPHTACPDRPDWPRRTSLAARHSQLPSPPLPVSLRCAPRWLLARLLPAAASPPQVRCRCSLRLPPPLFLRVFSLVLSSFRIVSELAAPISTVR